MRLLNLLLACFVAVSSWAQVVAANSPYALSMASYIGDSGSAEDVVAARILSDGRIALAMNVGSFDVESLAPPSARLSVLGNANASSPGVAMLLDRSGRQILAISRIADSVNDLDIDDGDHLYVACALDGLMKISADAGTVIWNLLAGEYIHRVAASPGGWVVAHRPTVTTVSTVDTSPGEGVTHLIDPSGALHASIAGIRNTVDVAVDEDSQTVIQLGWRQANTVQANLSTIPVQIAYLRGLSFAGELRWVNYDWDAYSDIAGGTQYVNGNLVITNPRFINTNGQPNGVDEQGRTTYAFLNNMADTRGYRVRMGRDGLLYAAYEAAGGNHIFKNRGLHDIGSGTFRRAFAQAGGDSFHSFINTGAGHKTYIGRYHPATGEILSGNEFNTLIRQNNNSMGANTLRMRAGGLAIDQSGQLFFGGASASGLPLRSNEFFSPTNAFNRDLFAIDAFGEMDTAGGAYLWSMDAALQRKLVISRLSYGNTRTVDARILDGETAPLVVYAGIAGMERPMLTKSPLQPAPGYGSADGFVVLLGGDGLATDDSLLQFSYGGSGVSYTPAATRLRGVLETRYSADLDGDGNYGESIAEYAWDPDVALSPPAPNYTGPVFRGGLRAMFFNTTDGNFPTNSYSGNNTNIRVQRSAPVQTNQNGVFFFDKADMPDVTAEDRLLINENSVLSIGGSGLSVGRWLIRNGDTYFVSDETFSGSSKHGFAHAGETGRWAPFAIDAGMHFDAATADFANRQFADVTAVGFIINNPEFSTARFQMQWTSFYFTLAKNIAANLPPVAVVQSNFSTIQNNPHVITFDATASYDPDGEVVFSFWDFGNGQSSSGPVVTTEYRAAGRYSPQLTVWDQNLVTATSHGYVEIGAPTAPNPQRLVAAWGGKMPTGGFRGKQEQSAVDLNGDGFANNNVRGWHFSETLPMTTNSRGTRWFGGLLSHYLDAGSVNFHDGGITGASPYDTFNVRFQRGTTGLTTALHGALFLDKSEFLGLAAQHPVRFTGESRMSMGRISRFNNIGQMRWLVREGTTYYVSQQLIVAGNPTIWTPVSDSDDGIWAEYDPEALYMDFDQDSADWQSRKFQNLTAFGFMWDKDLFDESLSWLTFNEFYVEAEAVPPVHGGSFAAWRAERFSASELADPSVSGPNARPDADGIDNLIKYAFGLPRDMAGVTWPVETWLPEDHRLRIHFTLLDDRSDIIYQVMASADLNHWEIVFDSRYDQPDSMDGTIATVRDNQPLSAEPPARFLRLAITLVP